MEFLVVSPTPTWPADLGGRKGIVSLHESLRRYGRIHFVLYGAEGEWRDGFDEEALAGMQRQWDTFQLLAPSRPVHTHAAGLDHTVDEWWDPVVGDYVSWRLKRGAFNALIVHYTWLSKALTFAPQSVHKVLYTADRFGGRREMFESRGFAKEFFHLNAEAEAEALARADTVIAVKEQEEAYFNTLVPGRAITVPHYEARIARTPTPADPHVLRIGMIGGYNTINRANFEAFLEVATATFSRYFAPIEIVVAGGMCDALTELENPYVRLVGYVDDLSDFYGSVDAVIVPMTWSSGIKIKFAEAVAAGVPTLSTAHAAEGYVTHHPMMRCADFEELAASCVQLAYDRSLLTELREAADKAFASASDRLTTGVDLLASRIASDSPSYLIFTKTQLLDTDSYAFTELWALLKYCGERISTTVALPKGAQISARALRKLKSVVPVVEGKRVADLDLSAFAGVTIQEWRNDLSNILKGYVGDIIIKVADSGMRDAVTRLRRAAPCASILIRRGPGSNVALRPEDESWVERQNLPSFYRTSGSVERAWRAQNAHHDILHILADAASIGLAGYLTDQARRWRPSVRCQIVRSDQERLSLVSQFSRPGLAGARPRCVLDLSGSSTLDEIREIYWRSAVPVVTLEPAADPFDQRPPRPTLHCESMGDLLCTLAAALLHPELFKEVEELTWSRAEGSFANDAGWVSLWRRLGGIKDVRRLMMIDDAASEARAIDAAF